MHWALIPTSCTLTGPQNIPVCKSAEKASAAWARSQQLKTGLYINAPKLFNFEPGYISLITLGRLTLKNRIWDWNDKSWALWKMFKNIVWWNQGLNLVLLIIKLKRKDMLIITPFTKHISGSPHTITSWKINLLMSAKGGWKSGGCGLLVNSHIYLAKQPAWCR